MDFQEAEPLLSGDTRGHTFQENNRLYALLAICMCTVALVTFGGTYAAMKNEVLVCTDRLALALAHPYEHWMADNWQHLERKTLMEITLPGSHNSGNTPDLSWHEIYVADDYYDDFVTYAKNQTGIDSGPVTREQYNARFVKWNINHHVGVAEQLKAGIRWFHLKVCNMGGQPMTLAGVRHCHRGFTGPTLQSIVEDITSFLARHPMETVALGLNNLFGIEGGDVAALANLLVQALQPVVLTMTAKELRSLPLRDAVAHNKRVALFMPVLTAVPGVITSANHLYENWDAAGDSGDLKAYTDWMMRDIRENATKSDRYYVLQANPNNNKAAMYDAVLKDDVGSGLYGLIYPLLRDLPRFVLDAVKEVKGARINAISTDFIYEARVVETAIALLSQR